MTEANQTDHEPLRWHGHVLNPEKPMRGGIRFWQGEIAGADGYPWIVRAEYVPATHVQPSDCGPLWGLRVTLDELALELVAWGPTWETAAERMDDQLRILIESIDLLLPGGERLTGETT
jgi:hypothetical protein